MKIRIPGLRQGVASLFVLAIICTSFYSYTSTSSAPTGYTNAPSEANCTSCHSGSVITSGTNWGNINLSTDIPATGYIPDSTYNITLSHSQSGIVKFGFSTTVLNSSNNKAGTLINTSSGTSLITGTRDYIGHNSGGTSGSGSISWSFKWKAPSTAVGNITFYSTVNASNNNSSDAGDQIYAKTFSFSQSSLLPTAVITPSATTLCTGDTLYLQGSGANNPTIFTWTLTGGTPSASGLKNPKVVYTSAGTYTVSLVTRNNKGASSASTVNITVNAKPSNTVIASGPLTFCAGDSVTLTSAPFGANITYAWSNSANTRSIVVKNTGNYQVTVTNTSSGCSSTSSVNAVTMRSLPVVTLSSSAVNDVICQGDSITFTATPGLKNYIFKNLNNTIIQNSSSPVYKTNTLSGNSSIYVSATDSFNCTGLNSDTVYTNISTRLAAPITSCGSSGTDSVVFSWNTVSNATGYEVSLDTGKTWSSPGSGNMGTLHIVRGLPYSHQVQLRVRAKAPAPCLFGLASIQTCSTKSCSGITYQFQSDSSICQGDTAEILLSHLSRRPFSIQLNSQSPVADTVFKVAPAVTETFTLLLRDSNAINCPPISIPVLVNVESTPNPMLSTDKINNTYCPGDSIQIIAPNTFVNYVFIKNGTDTLYAGSQNSVISKPAQGDNIRVWVQSAAQCKGSSAPIQIAKHALPQVNIASPQYLAYRKYLFTDSNTTAKRWLWDFGDQSNQDTLASPTHTYSADGAYTVTLAISDSNGCLNYTQRLIQVAPFASNNTLRKNQAYWELYPNPAASELFISNPGKVFSRISYSIYSITGKLMQHQAAREDFNGWLDVSDLPAGLYIIQLSDLLESGTLKFQKR